MKDSRREEGELNIECKFEIAQESGLAGQSRMLALTPG